MKYTHFRSICNQNLRRAIFAGTVENMRISICVIGILLSAIVWAHGEGKEAIMGKFAISSSAFRNHQPIPAKYSRDGADMSPALKWEGVPAGTKSFALICDDPDAPGGTWIHWVMYGIPGNSTGLPENAAKTETVNGAKQGVNSYGTIGYGG